MRRSQSSLFSERSADVRSDCRRRRAIGLAQKVRVGLGVLVIVLGGVVAATDAGAVAPPVPPGCGTGIATQHENTTPVAIPTGPAVVTSTIDVAGAGAHLTDVDLFTNITHTFAADLDVTLQSPTGTVVTITTDNGAGNDNVFAGTTFDDQANPGGQVPYATNPGLTTDNPYANNVAATPLAPEEALAAFNGEDPNGTWTLTISDDLAGDGGTLNNWRLDIQTLPAAPVTTVTQHENTTPVAIPTGPAVVTSTIDVAGAGAHLTDVDLFTNITHTFAADLDVTLQSPTGTVVTITTDNGAGNDNVFAGTTFDDQANPGGQVPYSSNPCLTTDNPYANNVAATPLAPEEALAAFNGEDPNGTWTLTISDDLAGDGGTLNNWRLDLTTGLCPSPSPTPSPSSAPLPAPTPESAAPTPESAAPPAPTPESPSLRVSIARLLVFAPGAAARCGLTTGRIDSCRVRLRVGKRVLASGTRSLAGGANSLRLRLRLTAYGRRLLDRRLGGLRAKVVASDGKRSATKRTRAILAIEHITTPSGSWLPNRAALTPSGRRFLQGLRGRLIAVSGYRCEGHSASPGTASVESEDALALSLARAELVCTALRRLGATGRRSVVARGGADPIAPNNTAAGRAKNRRVEVTLRH